MTTTEATSETVPAPKSGGRSPRDMALSLVVLMIPVLLIVLAYRHLYGGDQPVIVDPSEKIASAERAGQSPLPSATAPQDWQVLTAQYRDGVLRIGYLLPDGGGARLVQARIPAVQMTETELGAGARAEGTVAVNGADWQRLSGERGKSGLLREIGDLTVLLVGEPADLEKLAATYPR